jgi:membrane-bound lytic murein transglycosylase D
VPKLIAVKNIVLAPVSYGIELDSVPDQPYFAVVPAPDRIDVKVAAKLAGMSEEDFAALNPAHNRPVAVGAGAGIVLPVDKVDTFIRNLEAYDKPLVSWTTYNAKRGESLDAIARRHNVAVSQLKSANDGFKLDRKGRLRVASPVMVPLRGAAVAASAPAAVAALSKPAASPVRVAAAPSLPTASVRGPARGVASAASAVRTYTVKSGDTLYAIAQRFDTAVDTLLKLNRLTAKSVIQPGLTLRLP